MTEYDNYQTISQSSPVATHVDDQVVDALKRTKPWVRFLAVLGFILVGFMILASLGLFGVSLLASNFADLNPIEGVIISMIYIFSSVLYLIPSIFLWKYGTAINELMTDQSGQTLIKALDNQRSFWKVVGILTLIWLTLTVLFIAAAIVFGLFAAILAA